ncbi:hypothetical protein ACWEQ8_07280 [Streptomyces noursei]
MHHVLGRATHQFTNRVGSGSSPQETYLRLLVAQAIHDRGRPGRP